MYMEEVIFQCVVLVEPKESGMGRGEALFTAPPQLASPLTLTLTPRPAQPLLCHHAAAPQVHPVPWLHLIEFMMGLIGVWQFT
ncbi:hypothetical protein E2C01_058261 [Portunus trituberculatus]|uniref:Uncharacterized protein n=1 Tax=Portunus trituberculatus TaxID=210409 RepID=A0A5B7H2I0_PORTR|nr:hypothetical protein [Portunus trituberculatus]